jgi:circadian clock protein KaiB
MNKLGESVPARPRLLLRLYVAGASPRAEEAKFNLKRICAGLGTDEHRIDIVDVFRDPERMQADSIIATPTLIRLSPKPAIRILGTLSDSVRVQRALGLDVSAERQQ